MIAQTLHDVGFEDLVSVVPPGSMISSKSNIDPASLGKVPGRKGRSGWYGYAFTKQRVEPEKIDAWGANIGLLGNQFPALDIDSEWEDLTNAVLHWARTYLGKAPVRLSREPRRLLVYRTDEPFTRIALKVEHGGQEHTIEFMGAGRQYVVHGRHPAEVDYRWSDKSEFDHLPGPLWGYTPEDLTPIDREQALSFLESLQKELEARGMECEIKGTGKTKEQDAPKQEGLMAPNARALVEVVDRIPNTNDTFPERADYIRMGHAIKAAGGDVAVFHSWAIRWEGNPNSPEGNDPATVNLDWNRMQPPFRIGWSWLQDMAANYSDYCPAVDEFEPDPTLAPPEPAITDPDGPNKIELSDAWLTKRVLSNMGTLVSWVSQSREWHRWNDYAWELDDRNRVQSALGDELLLMSSVLMDYADNAPSKAERKHYLTKARALQSVDKLDTVLRMMKYQRELNRRSIEFDADLWLLNTPDGAFYLAKDERRRVVNDPALMCAKATAVAPQRGRAPLWTKFLDEATNGDVELQDYLQKLAGYCLTGDVSEQILPFIWGRSNTGKSVFLKTLSGVMGTYWKPASLEMFQISRTEQHPASLAELAGARLVTAIETQVGKAWDEQRIKALTAGDPMQVRRLYGHPFTLHPTFKIIVAGNHEPTIANLDDAMARRLHVVPLDQVVPPARRDRQLPQKLEQEWPQILAWMIQGCVMWQDEGLEPPPAVLARTSEYIAEENLLGQWLDECCDLDVDHETTRDVLYRSWQQWCHSTGQHDPGTKLTFKRKLKSYNFTDKRVGLSRHQGYRGIRVKPTTEEGIDGDL